jgi:hypothetical protein
MSGAWLLPCSFLLQDFPYNFEEGIEHWLLWSTEKLPTDKIEEHIAAKFPDCDTAYFVNPTQLQSVLAVSDACYRLGLSLKGLPWTLVWHIILGLQIV